MDSTKRKGKVSFNRMNGARRFYNKNKIICRIGFVAGLICVSYILTYRMNDYLGIEPIYSFMNNISISYLAALIFYVVQVYIPDEDNQKKSLEILKPKFIKLVEFIEVNTLVCQKYIEVPVKGANIKWTDGTEKIYFKHRKKDGKASYTIACYTIQDLISLNARLNQLLDDIRNATVFKYCDYDIAKKMTEIDEAKGFGSMSILVQLSNTDVNLSSIKEGWDKLRDAIGYIKEICGIDWEYEIEDIEPGDRAVADLTKGNVTANLKNIDDLNKKILKEKILASNPGIDISDAELDEICKVVMQAKTEGR